MKKLNKIKWPKQPKIYFIYGNSLTKDELSLYHFYLKNEIDTHEINRNDVIFIRSADYIYESKLKEIGKHDLILWHPLIASKNIDIVQIYNSVVILKKKTILIQKASNFNPFNENMAINLGVNLNYIDKTDDITNLEYKLVVSDNYYEVKVLGEYCKNFISKQNKLINGESS